ncbi:MAG: hypothetical protein IKD33_06675 [Bacteroidales bacterium]|nr:hypothetical protein [Bacteroidales bacterium]
MKRKILILIITIVAMAATQNAYCQTALYNQYKHLTDVRVVCIMDFPVDENVKVDITMLEPKTKEAVYYLVEEFNLGLDKEEVYNRFGKEEKYSLYTYYVRKDDVKKRFGEIKTDEDFKDIAKLAYNYNMGTIVIFHDIDTKERAIIVETFLVSTLKDRKKFPSVDNVKDK